MQAAGSARGSLRRTTLVPCFDLTPTFLEKRRPCPGANEPGGSRYGMMGSFQPGVSFPGDRLEPELEPGPRHARKGTTLGSFDLFTPEPDQAAGMYATLGLRNPPSVHESQRQYFTAEIETPSGVRSLS